MQPLFATARQSYRRTIELSLLVGVLCHLLVIYLTPPMAIEPFALRTELITELVAWQREPEIQIKEAPPDLTRGTLDTGMAELAAVEDSPFDVEFPEQPSPFPKGLIPGGQTEGKAFHASETEPVILKRTIPPYPEMAREAGAEGTVLVQVTIDIFGRVTRATVVSSDTIQSLKRAALDAARLYLFAPAKQGGVAVESEYVLTFEFRLR